MQRDEEEDEEEYDDDESEEESDKALFFMEPDHDKMRAREELKTQEYWEAGISADTINMLKQGNMDHSQKTCYHCNKQGHIKGNCPARKKLDAKPWVKRTRPSKKRTIGCKGTGPGRGRRRFPSNRSGPPRKKFTRSAQSIQQSEENF